MIEEFGYEVTPQQSLDGLWKTMHKYIEHHGHSDISLEMEGSQYEFRQHLEKYQEYEAKAKAWDVMKKDFEGIADTPIGQQMLFNMSVIMERVENGDYND